jgi:hypothetical protein
MARRPACRAQCGAIEGRDWREVARRGRASILLRLDAMRLLD